MTHCWCPLQSSFPLSNKCCPKTDDMTQDAAQCYMSLNLTYNDAPSPKEKKKSIFPKYNVKRSVAASAEINRPVVECCWSSGEMSAPLLLLS